MTMEHIQVEVVDQTGVITLNAPNRRNALSTAMRAELLVALDTLGSDASIGAIVIRGAGDNFCSGGDISEMAPVDQAADPAYVTRRLHALQHVVRRIAAGPKPVIASVEGVAFGGGFSLALACDHVVAQRNARFCASFGRIGLLADCGLMWTLTQRVGLGTARDILFTARVIEAAEGHRLGFVDTLADEATVFDATLAKAREYRSVAPLSIASTKLALSRMPTSLEDALHIEADLAVLLSMTSDHREGREAFQEKRAPLFRGR